MWTAPNKLREGDAINPGTTEALEVRDTISDEASPTQTQSTTVATDGGTDGAASSFDMTETHADASDDENQNLNDEYIVFENTIETTLDLGGWTVQTQRVTNTRSRRASCSNLTRR